MIFAFDNTFLSLIFNPSSVPTPIWERSYPISHAVERVEALIDKLSRRGDTVLIPAPCLTELLVAVPDFSKAITEIEQSSAFAIAGFDGRGALELAAQLREAKEKGDKKSGVEAPWNQVKFDRQIVSIAIVNGSEIIFTDDYKQSVFAEMCGLKVMHTWDLDLPNEYAQYSMLDSKKDPSKPSE